MRLNFQTFTDSKVEKDLGGFINDMEKSFKVIHVIDLEGAKFVAYQLKKVAYQWNEKWEELMGKDIVPVVWD